MEISFKQTIFSLDSKNQKCNDCGEPDVKFVSVNNGITLCELCAQIHQNFGFQISYIRSIEDEFDDYLMNYFIEYTGLRPGEKLYEEVLANSENTLPAFHERIRIAKVRSYDYKEAYDVVAALEVLSRKVDIENMVILMKKTVPEYKSKNSRFEIYDKN